MNELKIKMDSNWNLPESRIDTYARMISLSKTEMNNIPGPPVNFFKKRLRVLRENEMPTMSLHTTPYLNNTAVGWGHLSVFKENPSKAELFVFVAKRYRRKGIGTKMIKLLLDNVPNNIKEITLPALIKQRIYLKKHFNTIIQSSERRGLLQKKNYKFKPYNNYDIITNNEICRKPELIKYIIKSNGLKDSVEEYRMRTNLYEEILGKKQIFSFYFINDKILGYTHISYNFEENSKVAYIEEVKNKALTNDQLIEMYEKQLSFLFKETKVIYVLTFNYSEKDIVQQKLGFSYINSLDNHLMHI